MRNIYLLELSYRERLDSNLKKGAAVSNPSFYSLVANISSPADLTIRVGYFGVCIATHEGGNSFLSWNCCAKTADLVRQVDALQDPLNVLAIGDNFRDEVIASVIM
jgi:hypothetical protein